MSDPAPSDLLQAFPAAVRADHQAFLATGDLTAADRVVLAIVLDHIPEKSPLHGQPVTDRQHLIADLQFDSLALAEVVFFVEDLYRVRINQTELSHLQTVGDLRRYVHQRLAAPVAS